jgi:hypothetical protein
MRSFMNPRWGSLIAPVALVGRSIPSASGAEVEAAAPAVTDNSTFPPALVPTTDVVTPPATAGGVSHGRRTLTGLFTILSTRSRKPSARTLRGLICRPCRRLAALSSLFKDLARHGETARNQVVDVEPPAINRDEGGLEFSD